MELVRVKCHIPSLLQYSPCGVRSEPDVIGLKMLDNTRLKYDNPAGVSAPAIINEKQGHSITERGRNL
jgi:hypothetical protein